MSNIFFSVGRNSCCRQLSTTRSRVNNSYCNNRLFRDKNTGIRGGEGRESPSFFFWPPASNAREAGKVVSQTPFLYSPPRGNPEYLSASHMFMKQ